MDLAARTLTRCILNEGLNPRLSGTDLKEFRGEEQHRRIKAKGLILEERLKKMTLWGMALSRAELQFQGANLWAWKWKPDFEKLLGVEKSSSSQESLDSSKTSSNQNCTRYSRITSRKKGQAEGLTRGKLIKKWRLTWKFEENLLFNQPLANLIWCKIHWFYSR